VAGRADRAAAAATVDLYRGLLCRNILPTFGSVHINRITSATVRTWHATLRENGVGGSTVAKAYRLLKGILTAVEDDLIARNPCLRHAGAERPQERRPPTLPEVDAIASAISPRFRVLVPLRAWSGLRYGELGLSRQRIDPLHGFVHVREQLVQTAEGRRFLAPPKTNAGVRSVAIPPHPWPEIEQHLAATLAAVSGATTRQLMARMGHSSASAAMIYQYATSDRDKAVAEAMSRLVTPTPLPRAAIPAWASVSMAAPGAVHYWSGRSPAAASPHRRPQCLCAHRQDLADAGAD
jgi:hypothetical protein